MFDQIIFLNRPQGELKDSDFEQCETSVAEPGEGEVLVRNLFMSVDPYMRSRMNDAKSYIPPFQIGEVLQAGVVGQVIASNFDGISEGDNVTGMLGWENYSISDGRLLRKLPKGSAPLSWHLGILGMPGMTAYVGLIEVAKANAGDKVFVSAASGAVGSVVGQIAKIHGCHVAGSAGADEKVELLKSEFGYDTGFNYKTVKSVAASVRDASPDGIDVLFENVGGEIFEAALWHMRDYGRIALCGMISSYNDENPPPGPRGMMLMIARRVRMQGFIVTDYPEACEAYVAKAIGWMAEGKLNYRETVAEGVENAPQAFIGLLKGGNIGKQIVQLA